MSEEVLKSYTLRTLNFGVDFLSRLSNVTLPDELTEMHKHLSSCFYELNKVWENINKISVKHKKSEFKLDGVKNQLKELDTTQNHTVKHLKIQLFKSKSIGDLIEIPPNDTKCLKQSESDRETTPSPPTSNNGSPIVPPKIKTRDRKHSETSNGYEVLGKNYENCRRFEASYNNATTPAVKLAQTKGMTMPLSFERPKTPETFLEAKEDDYLIVEKERKLPGISKFSQLNKMSNVFVNRWQLGERYCGVSEGVLYIFRRFQDEHAEISMELPKMYLGKGSDGKSVLFQTRDIQIELISSDKEMQERFYKAAFQSQNKYDKKFETSQQKNVPQMPKPYSRKDSELMYINISTSIAHKIKRWRPVKARPQRLSAKADDDETEYLDINKIDQYVEMSNSRVKTSY